MKSCTRRVFIGAAALVAATAPAAAKSVEAKAGRTTTIMGFSLFDTTNCNFGPKPKVIFTQPEHGTLTAAWTSGKSNDKGKCFGKPMKGYIISYKPKAGFHGVDKGAVNFFYPTYVNGTPDKSEYIKLDISVR